MIYDKIINTFDECIVILNSTGGRLDRSLSLSFTTGIVEADNNNEESVLSYTDWSFLYWSFICRSFLCRSFVCRKSLAYMKDTYCFFLYFVETKARPDEQGAYSSGLLYCICRPYFTIAAGLGRAG